MARHFIRLGLCMLAVLLLALSASEAWAGDDEQALEKDLRKMESELKSMRSGLQNWNGDTRRALQAVEDTMDSEGRRAAARELKRLYAVYGRQRKTLYDLAEDCRGMRDRIRAGKADAGAARDLIERARVELERTAKERMSFATAIGTMGTQPRSSKVEIPAIPVDSPQGGFGGAATGGAGRRTVAVGTTEALRSALVRGNATIVITANELHIDRKIETRAGNITLDGRGATLRGDRLPRVQQLLKFVDGRNLVVKNLRLRNGGDNLAFYGSARDIVVDHVSSTGAGDDGISVSNDASNVTITHCFLAGNTRAIFVKYGRTANVTVAHCILIKLYMRAPMFHDVPGFDVRNNVIREWKVMGTRISGDRSRGNVMGNIYEAPSQSRGANRNRAITLRDDGRIHIAGNEFRNCTGVSKGPASHPLPAPPIVPAYTTNLREVESRLLSEETGAGCMPRDRIDRDYLEAVDWPIGESRPFRIPPTGGPLPR